MRAEPARKAPLTLEEMMFPDVRAHMQHHMTAAAAVVMAESSSPAKCRSGTDCRSARHPSGALLYVNMEMRKTTEDAPIPFHHDAKKTRTCFFS